MPRLPLKVKQHLEKARLSALSAVENYNKPGIAFRTRTYAILMVISWTALFHAIFYRRGIKPWYVESGEGRGIRYKKIEGDPKHWELATCLRKYFGNQNPPVRKNLEFMLRLRNNIEHRDHPELDPALYGECQAMLMNFEELVVKQFGKQFALAENLAVSLQFSALRQHEQKEALRKLQKSAASDIIEFVEKFRSDLPPEVLESSNFSMKVFLVPKIVNRASAADLAVEFISYDPNKPEQMRRLKRVTDMIKEKRVPVASSGLMRPGEVVDRLRECLPFEVNMYTHTKAWQYYAVRPSSASKHPEKTRSDFCVYDELMGGYGYTRAWVKHLCRELGKASKFTKVTGRIPIKRQESA